LLSAENSCPARARRCRMHVHFVTLRVGSRHLTLNLSGGRDPPPGPLNGGALRGAANSLFDRSRCSLVLSSHSCFCHGAACHGLLATEHSRDS